LPMSIFIHVHRHFFSDLPRAQNVTREKKTLAETGGI